MAPNQLQERVLIVEDDPISATALCKLLSLAGFDVTCVATVGSAHRELERHAPKFMILDLNLPDGDGTLLLQFAREKHPSIRIAVATATDREAPIASAAKRLEPDAFFRKPLHIADVIRWLRESAR